MNEEMIPSGELIDFSADSLVSSTKSCDSSVKIDLPCSQPFKENNDKVLFSNLPRRKSNENFTSSELISATKAEKPVIPDKPAVYSSCSLDRRSHRQLSTSRGDCMVRSHIERPTVPPPERPAKPPKFCSSENISGNNTIKPLNEENCVQSSIRSGPVSPDKSCSDLQQNDSNVVPIIKTDRSPSALQPSRSSTKINRFDFLVNQTNDKPPERPPRSTADHLERTSTIPESSESDPFENMPSCGNSKAPSHPTSEDSQSATVPPPISPRLNEVEKVKPPRPQPPVPAKPKFNAVNENTNL